MAALLVWQWVLIAVGIALATGSIIGTLVYILRRRRQRHSTRQHAGSDPDKERGPSRSATSSTLNTAGASPPPITSSSNTPSSSTTVDSEKLDRPPAQLGLMPLSPRRTHEKINTTTPSSTKYRSALDTGHDNEDDAASSTSKRRISLSPFLEGVESPAFLPPLPRPPPPTRSSDTTTNSSNSTLPSSIMLPPASTRLGLQHRSPSPRSVDHAPWRGPTPPWTILPATSSTHSTPTDAQH